MFKRIIVMLTVLLPFGPVLAQTCGNYPLTAAQSDALLKAQLDVVVPEGEVPFVQRCDIDLDGTIDRLDIQAITSSRNEPASDPDDPRDWDGDGKITVLDARGCVLACTLPRCASRLARKVPGEESKEVPAEKTEQQPVKKVATRAKARAQTTVGQPGQCFQTDDFDGDGKQDFIGIYEYVGNQTRGNNWNLQTVIIYEDAAGDTQVIAFPYTGQSGRAGSQIFQHVSLQPAGPVDLMPGGVMLSQPGVVSYRNNQPKTLYYFQGGQWSRAYYGIDD